MISKQLNIGDTFEDSGVSYTVVEVLNNGNYISKAVDAEEEILSDGETSVKPAKGKK